jgi:hypothetical protein
VGKRKVDKKKVTKQIWFHGIMSEFDVFVGGSHYQILGMWIFILSVVLWGFVQSLHVELKVILTAFHIFLPHSHLQISAEITCAVNVVV